MQICYQKVDSWHCDEYCDRQNNLQVANKNEHGVYQTSMCKPNGATVTNIQRAERVEERLTKEMDAVLNQNVWVMEIV